MVAEFVKPDTGLVMVTLAPGITAPVASETVPSIVPAPAETWANKCGAKNKQSTEANTRGMVTRLCGPGI